MNRNLSVASPLLASITVNTTDDVVDGNDGKCSFREALFAANFDSASGAAGGECAAGNGDDTISIIATGTINLSSRPSCNILQHDYCGSRLESVNHPT